MFITKREEKETICYTYEVKMIVQIIAENLEMANAELDANGGHVSSREVNLLDSKDIFSSNDSNIDSESTNGSSETI